MGIGRSWGSKEAWEEAGREEDRGHGSDSKWKRAAEKKRRCWKTASPTGGSGLYLAKLSDATTGEV